MSEILGPPVGYIDLLNHETEEHLKREASNRGGYSKTPIRPSAAGKCTRELYYELMEFSGRASYEKEARPPDVHRLLSLGHSIEWHLIKQFELINSLVGIRYKQQALSFIHIEAKNDPSLSQWLEGSLDLVFWSEKHKCVADVKSKKDRWDFKARTMNWDATTDKLAAMASVEPITIEKDGKKHVSSAFWVNDLESFLVELDDPFFAANFLQLNLYANAEFLKERGVNHGAILQYNKNDSRLREVRFRPSEKLYQESLTKFRNVVRAVDEDKEKLATRDFEKGSFKCRYCPFESVCRGKEK